MGLLQKVLNPSSNEDTEYVDLEEHVQGETPNSTGQQIRFGTLNGQEDVMSAKDALYRGEIVILSLEAVDGGTITLERALTHLKQTSDEIGGDIVQKQNTHIIVTPAGASVNRTSL